MFKLKRPCDNCPFRRGVGETFQLHPARLREIVDAPAFQCHKTVDYSGDDPAPGEKPQQCAGLMSVLHKAGKPSQLMQVAERLGDFGPDSLDHADTYDPLTELFAAHAGAEVVPLRRMSNVGETDG